MFYDGLIYSDSHMETEANFKSSLIPFKISDATAEIKSGPVMFRDGDYAYTDPSDAHGLIVGDTGSMKTLRFVLPMIYSAAKGGESMVIVDPKGELARKTHDFVKKEGYDTVILNFRSPQLSPDMWNPLGLVESEYIKGGVHKKNATMMLNDLYDELFFTRSDNTKDMYWNESAGQFAMGISTLILELEEKLNMKNILKWRFEMLPNDVLRRCFDSLPPDSETYQNLAGYMHLTAESTKSCIISTFDQLVRLFKASAPLTEMLSDSTFELSDIGKRKTAVYIVVPDEKTTFHFLATLFISQCYETLLSVAEEYGGRLPIRVNFILEEFCNMPRLADLVAMLTAARSRNIRFQLVIQSYSQMADKYGEKVAKTVMDNCGNLIYLHSRELSFLQYISDLAGFNEYGRPLLSVSRLQRLKKNETLIFHDRCYPFLTKDIPLIFEYPVTLGEEVPRLSF